jgi:TetR/AcrR family transcriptional repressor of nem operon
VNAIAPPRDARAKLLEAALHAIRAQGYAATSVDDLCRAAGVTKGAFFHHFKSKQDLAVAAADHWSETTGALFAAAPYHAGKTARDRVLAYIDFRTALLDGDIPDFTCLVGTMAQEVYATHPDIRAACAASIFGHAKTLEDDIARAMADAGVDDAKGAQSLAQFTQAVLQGAFVLAKARNDATIARDMAGHLRAYVELLFEKGG